MISNRKLFFVVHAPGVFKEDLVTLGREYSSNGFDVADALYKRLPSRHHITMNSGEMVDDNVVLAILAEALSYSYKGWETMVVYGAPNTIGQAKGLPRILKTIGVTEVYAVSISLPAEEGLRRLSIKGIDPSVAKKRVDRFSSNLDELNTLLAQIAGNNFATISGGLDLKPMFFDYRRSLLNCFGKKEAEPRFQLAAIGA